MVRIMAHLQILALLLLAFTLRADEDRLAAIHRLLVPLRRAPFSDTRGATPALTEVKHQLRDWIESRLVAVRWNRTYWTRHPTVLQEQLNDEMNHADLFCPRSAPCEDQIGYLDRIELELQHGFLVVRTSAGIQTCGTDDSAYIYEYTDDNWRRIWQGEQDNYGEKTYHPQRLVDVRISPTDLEPGSRGEHLVVTTGVFPWCSSVLQPVYYRVWQIKSTSSTPLLLLDGSEQIDIAMPIHARANRKDVFIEFHVVANDAMRPTELRHYVLENGKLNRTDPVALTPQEFVSFWLRHPWSEVARWTSPASRVALKTWREQFTGANSAYGSRTLLCTRHPGLWQVASDTGRDLRTQFFLVRARPPFRFTMVAASNHPWPDCTEDDPAIGDPPDIFDR